MYIPDKGIYFQLVNISTNSRLFSRDTLEPHVNTFGGPEFDDQWFTLIYGTPENGRGELYALHSKATPKVVFSRATGNPRVGNIERKDQYDDTWFTFKEGTEKHANEFRILCPATSLVIYSRFTGNPTFGNHPAREVFDDQYFKFNFEEMVIAKVDLDVGRGQIVKQPSEIIAVQLMTNKSDHEETMQFKFSSTVTETSLFEYGSGFTIGLNTTFESGTLFIASEEKIEVGAPRTHQFGTLEKFPKNYTGIISIVIGPHSSVRATAIVQNSILNVPYTMTLHPKRDSAVEVHTKGIWTGLITNLTSEIQHV